jgi:hypothetical protein
MRDGGRNPGMHMQGQQGLSVEVLAGTIEDGT